jgi:very-short-patch-repair endonuclease
MDALAEVRRRGGVARTRELRAAGLGVKRIAAECHLGRIERVRIGWYVDPALDGRIKQALRVGGRLTCESACAVWGGAALDTVTLHVEVRLHDSRFRRPAGEGPVLGVRDLAHVVLHWRDPVGRGAIASPVEAMLEVLGCLTPLAAVCALDAVLRAHPGTRPELERRCPPSGRRVLALIDPRSESVPESVFRVRAHRAGIPCLVQAPLPFGRRADFLIGERLVVEIDGALHHAGAEAFRADRERDALLTALGYRVIRFTYDQVVRRWDEVEHVLRVLIRDGEHIRR